MAEGDLVRRCWKMMVIFWMMAAQFEAVRLPYSFGYQFKDDYGTIQSREEKTEPSGAKIGSYSFVDASGIYRKVEYIADGHGFRATVTTNEPGTINVDPADVHMRTEKMDYGVPILHQPNQEYGRPIYANLSSDSAFTKSHFRRPQSSNHGLLYQNSAFKNNAILNSQLSHFEDEIKKPFYKGTPIINSYKGNPLPVHPTFPTINPTNFPSGHGRPQEPVLSPLSFLRDKNVDSGFNFDAAFALIKDHPQHAPVPTRYQKHNGEAKNKGKLRRKRIFKIHIPLGYENNPNLPLYRDR